MDLVRSAGQVLAIEGLPQGVQVSIAGAQVQPSQDGTFAIPAGREVDVVVSRGGAELFRSRVPATPAGQRVDLRYVEARAVVQPYEPGSRDDVRNRAAKGKVAMSLFGIGAGVGALVAVVKAWREG